MQNFHEILWVLQEGKQTTCFQERVEPVSQVPSLAQATQNLGFSFLLVVAKQGGKVKESTCKTIPV